MSSKGVRSLLANIPTPALVLDVNKMRNNINRLRGKLSGTGVGLRPHLKTAKSIEISREILDDPQGSVTVSTLQEAEAFSAAGIKDIIYAVGISPSKLGRVAELRGQGTNLSVLVDSLEQAIAVNAFGSAVEEPIPVWIEIDVDGHRGGVKPESQELLDIATALDIDAAPLAGVLAHAGESYEAADETALQAAAENERSKTVYAANRLRRAGLSVPGVSIGSTPTAFSLNNFDGLTEIRAGVYVFFDLVMSGLGICSVSDIAISVLATVIGHQYEKGWIIVDAGWSAMSSDRGTSRQSIDQGYGLVCDLNGAPFDDLILAIANQEHGILALREGADSPLPHLPIGSRVRILPNHACATASQHDGYWVISDVNESTLDWWPRIRGW